MDPKTMKIIANISIAAMILGIFFDSRKSTAGTIIRVINIDIKSRKMISLRKYTNITAKIEINILNMPSYDTSSE
jgi:hypothetical protein